MNEIWKYGSITGVLPDLPRKKTEQEIFEAVARAVEGEGVGLIEVALLRVIRLTIDSHQTAEHDLALHDRLKPIVDMLAERIMVAVGAADDLDEAKAPLPGEHKRKPVPRH